MRSGSSLAAGTRYGMRAAAIFFFARVIRAAIVGSLTRKARATSAVDSPQSSRSVSAIWASCASAGWQHVQIRRSRSSAISPPSLDLGSRCDVVHHEFGHGAPEECVAPEQVEGAVARRRGQPCGRTGRDAGLGPVGQRPGIGVLDAFLGEVEVTRDAHRRGEDEAPLATVRVGHGRGNRRGAGAGIVSAQLKTMIGRTSRPPPRAGICLASSIASSRSAASTR